MASTTGYKTERWGVSGNATQNTNQPLGVSVAVAGGALAVIDATTKLLKDATGSLGSNDICLGLIHTNRSSVSPSNDINAEIETGSFFLPFDAAPTQCNVGATVYISGEHQVFPGGAVHGSRPGEVVDLLEMHQRTSQNHVLCPDTPLFAQDWRQRGKTPGKRSRHEFARTHLGRFFLR